MAVGLVVRRLVSRVAARAVRAQARLSLEPLQLGFSSGGAEAAVHAVSRDAEHHGRSPQYVVATLDFSGAFTSVSRQCVVDEVAKHAPTLLPWVSYTYGCSADFYWEGHRLPCSGGVQQGDPLGPLLFAFAVHPLVERVRLVAPGILQVWFLDDGTLAGEEALVAAAVKVVEDLGRARGLSLNAAKSVLWSPSGGARPLEAFPLGFRQTPEAGVRLLGAPLSLSQHFRESFLLARVVECRPLLLALRELYDPQAQLLLLRACAGVCRLVYYLRCTPPAQAGLQPSAHARALDREILSGLQAVLGRLAGRGLTERQVTWAGLPLALGGLGLTPATTVERYAWLASYHDTRGLQEAVLQDRDTPESPYVDHAVVRLQGVYPSFEFSQLSQRRTATQATTQSTLGARVAEIERERLVARLGDTREGMVLQSCSQPFAHAWLRALPREGQRQRMPAAAFRCRLAYQLALPVYPPGLQCPLCRSPLDRAGDHAA